MNSHARSPSDAKLSFQADGNVWRLTSVPIEGSHNLRKSWAYLQKNTARESLHKKDPFRLCRVGTKQAASHAPWHHQHQHQRCKEQPTRCGSEPRLPTMETSIHGLLQCSVNGQFGGRSASSCCCSRNPRDNHFSQIYSGSLQFTVRQMRGKLNQNAMSVFSLDFIN